MRTDSISRRLDAVERITNKINSGLHSKMQELLKKHGYLAVRSLMERVTWPRTDRVVEFERLLLIAAGDALLLDDYRGLVPDEVLRQSYSLCRNWGGFEMRRKAGVIDEQGNAMPGYVLLDNGCIVDAPA